jgi:hypothetical protein
LRSASLLAVAALVACSDPGPFSGARWTVQVGQIVGPIPPVDAPDTVIRDEVFSVTVVTFGSSSCTRPAGAEVLNFIHALSIAPLDSVLTGDGPCTADLAAHPRTVDGVFPSVGTRLIAVSGRAGFRDTVIFDTVIVREP